MEKPYRVIVGVRDAVNRYYAAFPNAEEARVCNVAEVEIDELMLKIPDVNSALDNLQHDFNLVMSCNELDSDNTEILAAVSTLELGKTIINTLREHYLYDRKGQLIGRFEYLINDSLLCLYVDEEHEE